MKRATEPRTFCRKCILGSDPQIEKAEARAQASATLRNLVERYLDERAANRLKPRSLQEVERHLRVLWSPVAELPAKRVTRADVAAQLGKIAKQNGPFAANRARASLSALFSWAIGEGLCDANPVVGTNRPTEEIRRDRVLTDAELAAVWGAVGIGDYAAIVRPAHSHRPAARGSGRHALVGNRHGTRSVVHWKGPGSRGAALCAGAGGSERH
jgi:hypothetical protein